MSKGNYTAIAAKVLRPAGPRCYVLLDRDLNGGREFVCPISVLEDGDSVEVDPDLEIDLHVATWWLHKNNYI